MPEPQVGDKRAATPIRRRSILTPKGRSIAVVVMVVLIALGLIVFAGLVGPMDEVAGYFLVVLIGLPVLTLLFAADFLLELLQLALSSRGAAAFRREYGPQVEDSDDKLPDGDEVTKYKRYLRVLVGVVVVLLVLFLVLVLHSVVYGLAE